MAIKTILEYPHDVLRQKTEKVNKFDRSLHNLLRDMFDTMMANDGVGLAAPQVGVSKQIAIVDIGDDNGTIELINPVVLEKSGSKIDLEGCLSFPGLYGNVERPLDVKIKAQDRFGKFFIIKANDFLARACLHEIDHLHGKVFTDTATNLHELTEEELEAQVQEQE